MKRRELLSIGAFGLAAIAVGGVPARAAGGDPRFPAVIDTQVDGRPVRMTLSGTAQRTRYTFRVYAIGSYVQEGVAVRRPEALATLDAHKRLHLIFDRNVDGKTMAQSFRESIGLGHPAPAFAAELAALERFFIANPVKQGDHIWLTHLPGVGLGVQLNSQPMVAIRNVAFAQATWGAYMGPNNIGVAIQQGLSSRLR